MRGPTASIPSAVAWAAGSSASTVRAILAAGGRSTPISADS